MELRSLTLSGFRRFHKETTVQLDGKLVALVGPNEAGKTTLLKALNHFSGSAGVPLSDATYAEAEEVHLITKYALSRSDAEAAALVAPSFLFVHKRSDGKLKYHIEPRPPRNLELRHECASKLREILEDEQNSRQTLELSKEEIEDAYTLLSSRPDIYQPAELKLFRRVVAALTQEALEGEAADSATHSEQTLKNALNRLIEFEAAHDPHQDAIGVLAQRTPAILEFTQEYRDLQLPYNVSLLNHKDAGTRKSPSRPLQKLLDIAGLDIAALHAANLTKNGAEKAGILAEANERLESHCSGRWSQSDAYLEFVFDNGLLDILVKHVAGFTSRHRYNNFADRSDGYRQFIALQIFSLLHDIENAILLVDEMEQHLHYDAQADLVQMLTAESRIGKVIYTTHSAGCLPEDMGSGVRLVEWDPDDKRRSKVLNRFWGADSTAGFAPLLFGMGATTLSFFPTRKVLLGEGPTELLLLPKLFREAMQIGALGFQVLHGLSNLSLQGIRSVDQASIANGTAFCSPSATMRQIGEIA